MDCSVCTDPASDVAARPTSVLQSELSFEMFCVTRVCVVCYSLTPGSRQTFLLTSRVNSVC